MNVPGHNPAPEALVTQILKQITNLNRQLPPPGSPVSDPAQSRPVGAPVSDPAQFEFMSRPDRRSSGPTPTPPAEGGEGWESETVSGCAPAEPDFGLRLQQRMLDMGILPAFARHVLEYLQTSDREGRAESPQDELLYLRALLRSWWRPAPAPPTASSTQSHVFVGPGGAGKTTVLSKWLAQAVLLGGQSACVWRLDGCTANTAEALTVYAEILGVPIARAWTGESMPVALQFFDLPGVDWRDAGAVAKLSLRIQELGTPHVHLVLNAAYETPLLLHQARAFSSCSIADLIFTHLDEETRWGKLWNLVAGTDLPIRFLSAGQNVPGHFREATPGLLLPEGRD